MTKLVCVSIMLVIGLGWYSERCDSFTCFFCNHWYPELCKPDYTMDCDSNFCLTISTWRFTPLGAQVKQYIRACPVQPNDTCDSWAKSLEVFNDTFHCDPCYTTRCNNKPFVIQPDNYGNYSFKEPHDFNSVNLTEIMGEDSGY